MKKIMLLSIMLLAVAITGCKKDELEKVQSQISLTTTIGTINGTNINTGGENINPFNSETILEYGIEWKKTTETIWKSEFKSDVLNINKFTYSINTGESGVNYEYRAFVKTNSDTFYGNTLTIKTQTLEEQYSEWKNLTSTYNTNDLHGLTFSMKIEGNNVKLTYTHNSETKIWEYSNINISFQGFDYGNIVFKSKKTLTAPDELYFSFEYKTSNTVRLNVTQLTNYEQAKVWIDMIINH